MRLNLIIFLFLFAVKHSHAQNKIIDSLKQAFSVAKEDSNKVWTLDALSRAYTWSFADTAIMYAQQEVQLSQQLNFQRGKAWGMSNLTNALTSIGNYSNALDFGYKSLMIFKERKDTSGIVLVELNLATCYRELGDYKRAIELYRQGATLFDLRHEDVYARWARALLGFVYERNNQLDSALFYVQKYYEDEKEWSGLLTVLGTIHAKLGHDTLALDFYRKSIPFAIENNEQIDILDAYNGIAHVYQNEGNIDSAIYYAGQTLKQKWGKAYPVGLLNASTLLADIYASKNISDSTVKYLKLTITLKDSLFNRQKTREAQNFAFNEQLHQQELQQTQLKYRNRFNIYILLTGLVILIIIAGSLWRRNIFKQKSFMQLQKQKHETDIQKIKVEATLEELKATQSQLIQSEKMASLGELTAGIAHEIQNPLNFVNNFSEVSAELIKEMVDEVDKGNTVEVKAIAGDLVQNLEKINHHGKRADAIVKGMLQHSRSSSGTKESTDINALCDEYLRLAYHGLRAKDKSFNATLKTDFDESIGKINIIPQDIGRVILNLITNAFYALAEKKKQNDSDYEPTVTVSTSCSPLLRRGVGGEVIISVKDNGAGIPKNILDKIFQPFFTTKPTGQGTGLGLSLSYDIVKAHAGELKVETKTGEGSEFIIQLPIIT